MMAAIPLLAPLVVTPLAYARMTASVKSATKSATRSRVEQLRLQLMASEMAERIGLNMKLRREQLGLKQREVADRIDDPVVSAQHVSRWERAENRPGDRYLELIASALGVDVSFFYADHGVKPTTPDLMTALKTPNASVGERVDILVSALGDILDRIEAIEKRQSSMAGDLSRVADDLLALTGHEGGSGPLPGEVRTDLPRASDTPRRPRRRQAG